MCEHRSCLRIFSERRGSKSRSRPWRLSRHVPVSAITDRWDESPCQAWMKTGWNHCIMEHLIHPTHTDSNSCWLLSIWEDNRLRDSADVSFTAWDFDGIFSVLRDHACVEWRPFLLSLSVFMHQQMFFLFFLYEWRISYWDYVSRRWMNNSVCDLKKTVHHVGCQVCTLQHSHQTA